MLAALPSRVQRVRGSLRQDARLSYERRTACGCPTGMITLANAFILVLVIGAAALGISALVEKRTVRRHREHESSTNAAS